MVGYRAPSGCAIVGRKKICIGAKITVVPFLGPSAWVTDGQDDQTKWRNHRKKSWQVDCGEDDVCRTPTRKKFPPNKNECGCL
ncbi:hypothetical protein ACSBR1_043377 [Camellia fascicularis]